MARDRVLAADRKPVEATRAPVAIQSAVTAQTSPDRHVRATKPRIIAVIDAGLSYSETFRRLVMTLNHSDVIVYIEPKLTREDLGGFLVHNVAFQGGQRYLRILVDPRGAPGRVVPILAHELQHAVEVAGAPDARDAESLERVFSRLAVKYNCRVAMCYETQAAKDVERLVRDELSRSGKVTKSDGGQSRADEGTERPAVAS
jgi:hypothetical protein